jgi:hypothetical protein
MKTIAAILCLFALTCSGANIVFNLADFTTGSITNREVQILPKSAPKAESPNSIISRDRKSFYSNTSGTFTATNVVDGVYVCTLKGTFANTEWRMLVPDTNGTLYASDLIISGNSTSIDTEDGNSLDME